MLGDRIAPIDLGIERWREVRAPDAEADAVEIAAIPLPSHMDSPDTPPPSLQSQIPWRRFLTEGAVIVGSILLAFAIDAWWDGRVKARDTHLALQAVEDELAENLAYFEAAEAVYREAARAGGDLLRLTGPAPTDVDGERVSVLIGDLWRGPVLDPPSTGALTTLISTGSIARVRDPALRQELAQWPDGLARLQTLMAYVRDEDLFHQRMLLHIAQLDFDRVNGMTIVPSARAQFLELVPEASRFESDWSGLLADRQFESGVTGRTMLTLAGAEMCVRAQDQLEAILTQVRAELR